MRTSFEQRSFERGWSIACLLLALTLLVLWALNALSACGC